MSLANGAVIMAFLVLLIERHRKSPTICKLFDLRCLHCLLTNVMTFRQAIAGDVQELLRRVLDLENALSQIQSQGQLSNQTSPWSMPSMTPGAIQDASTQGITPSSLGGQTSQTLPSSVTSPLETPTTFKPQTRDIGDVARYLGQNWYHKGIPILSERGRDWIRLKTGQDAQFERFHMFGSKRGFPALPLTNLSYHELHKLPDRHYAESCLDAFFGSSISLFYPVLDRALVQETLEVAYQDHIDPSFTRSQVSAKACILAALCMITRTVRPKDASKQPQGDLYVDQSKSLLALVSWEACIEGLQATLMLVSIPKVDQVSGRWLIVYSKFAKYQSESGKTLPHSTQLLVTWSAASVGI